MQITVHVRKKDIRKGVQFSRIDCPIARAIARALRQTNHKRLAKKVSVGRDTIRAGKREVVNIPDEVADFITRYDSVWARKDTLTPFQFDLVFRRQHKGVIK